MKPFTLILFLLSILFSFSQQTESVDFKTGSATLFINPLQKKVEGKITYAFDVLKKIDTICIDAQQMTFNNVTLNGKALKFHNSGKSLCITNTFKPKKKYTLTLDYVASPKKAMYFIGWYHANAKKQVWTQGQGKYTSNWLPSFDDMNEKVIYNLTITFLKEYQVISNGKLTNKEIVGDYVKWQYSMEKPMSSYLLAIAIGDYKKKELTASGNVPIELYYYPEDSLKVEPTYRYTKRIFDFLEAEIGVTYPWQNYKQVPVKDFLYAGMENTSTTIFSDAFMIDSVGFTDKNYVNVNAHELAHQWFGNYITEKSGNHHWLQEGFATYYALLAEREIFGDDYYYWKLYSTAQQLSRLSEEGRGERLTDPKASSLTFYEKGAWALHMLREQTGDSIFKTSIKTYLENHQLRNVTIDDFISTVETVGKINLSDFENIWLKQTKFPIETALSSLLKSKFIRHLEAVEKYTPVSITNKVKERAIFHKDSAFYYPLKAAYIRKVSFEDTEDAVSFYENVLTDNDIKTRQALIASIDSIPLALKEKFELLLTEKSYVTVETALIKLWQRFPEDRKQYLEKTRKSYGFNDRSLRILWLALALVTPEFDSKNTPVYFNELSGYTAPIYHFEIRQNAIQLLSELQAFTNKNLKDLVNGCLHPVWQFSKFSRKHLDQLLTESVYKQRLEQIISELSVEEQRFLRKKLNNSK